MGSVQMDTVPLGAYVFSRLKALGVRSVFGVPGDYNLPLLDFVEPAGLHWVGNCNELNAAYAADGYARINGLSVIITTFGVGELSAINGIAGAYAERAPVIHIVGTPTRNIQSSRALMHHTFADGEFNRFAAMHAHVTVAQTSLKDARHVPDQVDWIIEQALLHQRPVYIQIPEDMAGVPVSASNLQIRPTISPSKQHAAEASMEHVAQILDRMYAAKQPMILVDGESRSLGILDEIDQLIKATGWPCWTAIFGKGLVNEELPNVHGTYQAEFGDEASAKYFKTSDLVLFFGPQLSNTNTHSYASIPDEKATIAFSTEHIKIGSHIVRDASARLSLQKLLQNLESSRLPKIDGPSVAVTETPNPSPSDPLSQALFYRYVNPMFRKSDIILTETGTASEGGLDFKLPHGSRFFTAATWLSIGYMLPATLGAALAQRDSTTDNDHEESKRAVLFIGDGSLQMTAQELSIIIKEKLNVVIIVINNDGYTTERAIYGRNGVYNDVAHWNYHQLLSLFGLSDADAAQRYFPARTWGELRAALDSKQLQQNDGAKVIEVFMDKEDVNGELRVWLDEQISKEKKL